MKELELKIDGMSCQHCKKSVENILGKITGIQAFEVFLEDGKASIQFDEAKVKSEDIVKAFDASSYQVS